MLKQSMLGVASIFLALTIFIYHTGYSASISIEQIRDFKCTSYTGTWSGLATNPNGLFDNGGPWPIQLKLDEHDGVVVGKTSNITGVMDSRKVWASCYHGQLYNIFWGDKGTCGRLTHKGLLITDDLLIINLGYQNAMNDADFYLFLTRQDNTRPKISHKGMGRINKNSITTCH